MKTPNIALLDLVLKTVETDQEHWDQTTWRTPTKAKASACGCIVPKVLPVECDTAFCFAGWAVQLGSEQTPVWVSEGTLLATEEEQNLPGGCAIISASERAERLLGITTSQANDLFKAGNSLGTLKFLVSRIKESAA